MPNWTSNRIEAPAEVLKKYISKDEDGNDRFDFNLVIPRPEIYNDPDLVAGGHEEKAISCYLHGNTHDDLYEIGKKYVEAHDKYGYYDWYDWSCANWGTKWNACDCVINLDEGWVEFEIAWCMPEPIIRKIMQDNHNCEIRIIWHDEDYNGTHTFEYDGHGGYSRHTVYEEQYMDE